jgi:hypothetical protein
MPRCVADFFIVHGFVVNNAVLLCGFKQTKGKRYETSDSFDRTADGIGHIVCVNRLRPIEAGGGGMTKDEALDLALEALENHEGNYKLSDAGCDRHDKAITAIKQVRALDKKAENARELGLDYEPVTTLFGSLPVYDTPPAQPAPVQEPLTVKLKDDWRTDDFGRPIIYDTDEVDEVTHALTGDEGEEDSLTVLNRMVRYVSNVWPGKTALQVLIECEEAMIATPPAAKRQWVGLTDEQIIGMYNEPRSDAEMIAFGREVEAKLKEKNT